MIVVSLNINCAEEQPTHTFLLPLPPLPSQYKNQQREIQFQLKKQGLERISVMTIDQCQGQEADIVMLSLVRKPTRFLDKNRMNVALSRVRQTLYFFVDKALFTEASRNSGWECDLLAKDLLRMTTG